MMWSNKFPPNTVFMDKEIRLFRSPDIFADFRHCPFRNDIFDCVIFDPPHIIRRGGPIPWFSDPSSSLHGKSWYGYFDNKIEALTSINKAQKEFSRIGKRLCFKWNESTISLWKILPFFKEWHEIYRKEIIKDLNKSSLAKTYWITFIRSSLRTTSEKVSDKPEILLSDTLLDYQVIENGATSTTN